MVAEELEYSTALKIKTRSSQWPGVSLHIGELRDYARSSEGKNYFSHLIGYTGTVTDKDLEGNADKYALTDKIGRSGLELSYEKELRGADGREQIEVDALGKTKKLIAREPATTGSDLYLSIDSEVQEALAKTLASQLSASKKTRGAAIAMDPRNGEIIAMVSLPDFDNNLFARKISQTDYKGLIENSDLPLFNRIVSGEYPSGSTFKPMVAAAALEEGLITKNTVVSSVGGLRVSQWFFPDWKAGGHGYTNVTKAIAWSVNTFFYYIGGGYQSFKGLGVSKIIRYAKSFGLGEALGVDLPSEKSGFLPTPEWKESAKGERWYIGDTYHLAIGQGDLLVTPLQLTTAISAVANGGIVYRPHLVKAFGKTGETIRREPEILSKDFVSPANLAIIRQGMRETVTYGSATRLDDLPVTMAGKTGTAQWHSTKLPHAWFTGFAPYQKPEIVITVLIEEGGEGSAVSVPVAHDFMNWYFGTYKKAQSKLTLVDKEP